MSPRSTVIGLTKALAVEWARFGVRVNAVCPGITETDMVRSFAAQDPERYTQRVARVPLGRSATIEEQVGFALFLASPESAYVTGAAIPVDGAPKVVA